MKCVHDLRPLCIYSESCVDCISFTVNEAKVKINHLEAENKALREKLRNARLREINRDLASKQQVPQVISVWQLGYQFPQPHYELYTSACQFCSTNTRNGGSGICSCTLGLPKIT